MDREHWFPDLVRLETRLWNLVDSELRIRAGIGLGAYDVLDTIQRTPQCRVQDIARNLEITVGGTSQAIDRLERDGLCRRLPNPADRRSSLLELTVAGEQRRQTASRLLPRVLGDLIGDALPAEDLAAFGRHVAALRGALTAKQAIGGDK